MDASLLRRRVGPAGHPMTVVHWRSVAAVSLPIVSLGVSEQRYSCHGCGNCCRDFTVELRPADLERLEAQGWAAEMGRPVTVDFRGRTYLRQRADGSCIFLEDDGRCAIHARLGFDAKPLACRVFPFTLAPGESSVRMGLSFACQSVLDSRGAALPTHVAELRRLAREIPEARPSGSLPLLTDRLRADAVEARTLTRAIDGWCASWDIDLQARLDGLAWVSQSLASARLEAVRGKRFGDLLEVLFGALPEELDHHPLRDPTRRQLRMLRQAVFWRTEDPKLGRIERAGRLRVVLGQLRRDRRFRSGRGVAPVIGAGWPDRVDLRRIVDVAGASQPDAVEGIDDVMTRYLRASVIGGRCWGAGYYGWPMIAGLQALLLNVAATGWLARLHALGRDALSIDADDVKAALGRVDRAAGRARWVGSSVERLRLGYLQLDDGLRRLIAACRLVDVS